MPDIKFDNISLNAKPNAKPVNPKPATIAETFIPMVPNAVINPTIISVNVNTFGIIKCFKSIKKIIIKITLKINNNKVVNVTPKK